MRLLAVLSILSLTFGCNASSESAKKNLPINKDEVAVNAEQKKIDGKEEDCDDKAKEVIEIKEETISLTGNTGCSLDEIH